VTSTDTRLRLSDLCVDVFDESIAARRRLVSGVSFGLAAGHGLGITGESGSGKTTLSLALSGLLPSGSRVLAHESTLSHVFHRNGRGAPGASRSPAAPRRLSYLYGREVFTLFQEPRASLNPYRTIGWQLNRCLSRRQDRFATAVGPNGTRPSALSALESVGLHADVSRHYPHELSTGMCQRVFLAMASLLGSSLLIADEPFASLDSDSQSKLAALVQDWMRTRGIALVLVSHDLDLLRHMTQHMLVMYRGQVAESGPTERVLAGSSEGHPYTRLLREVGEPVGRRSDSVLRSLHEASAAPCCFATRCAWADDSICVTAVPEARPVTATPDSDWLIRCLRHSLAPLRGPATSPSTSDEPSLDTGNEILSVRNVTKEFTSGWLRRRTRVVLNDVSLDVRAGERVGILGPSGQGKTTLARVILGLVSPTCGEVEVSVGDRRLNVKHLNAGDRALFRRCVQMVYQDSDLILDPGDRIGESLIEAYQVFRPQLDAAAAYRHARHLLRQLALPESLLEAYPYRLSGGERKRVALARSLAAFGCPFGVAPRDAWRLLILDEPTAGVDVFLQAILSRFLLWAQRRLRLSYLVISHDENFVRTFCHRALRISGGRIAQDPNHAH
jgi:peptide/nickel transport system ATP-binding protein